MDLAYFLKKAGAKFSNLAEIFFIFTKASRSRTLQSK